MGLIFCRGDTIDNLYVSYRRWRILLIKQEPEFHYILGVAISTLNIFQRTSEIKHIYCDKCNLISIIIIKVFLQVNMFITSLYLSIVKCCLFANNLRNVCMWLVPILQICPWLLQKQQKWIDYSVTNKNSRKHSHTPLITTWTSGIISNMHIWLVTCNSHSI